MARWLDETTMIINPPLITSGCRAGVIFAGITMVSISWDMGPCNYVWLYIHL